MLNILQFVHHVQIECSFSFWLKLLLELNIKLSQPYYCCALLTYHLNKLVFGWKSWQKTIHITVFVVIVVIITLLLFLSTLSPLLFHLSFTCYWNVLSLKKLVPPPAFCLHFPMWISQLKRQISSGYILLLAGSFRLLHFDTV